MNFYEVLLRNTNKNDATKHESRRTDAKNKEIYELLTEKFKIPFHEDDILNQQLIK